MSKIKICTAYMSLENSGILNYLEQYGIVIYEEAGKIDIEREVKKANYSQCSCLVIDLDACLNEGNIINNSILYLKNTAHLEIIVLALGRSKDDDLVKKLAEHNISIIFNHDKSSFETIEKVMNINDKVIEIAESTPIHSLKDESNMVVKIKEDESDQTDKSESINIVIIGRYTNNFYRQMMLYLQQGQEVVIVNEGSITATECISLCKSHNINAIIAYDLENTELTEINKECDLPVIHFNKSISKKQYKKIGLKSLLNIEISDVDNAKSCFLGTVNPFLCELKDKKINKNDDDMKIQEEENSNQQIIEAIEKKEDTCIKGVEVINELENVKEVKALNEFQEVTKSDETKELSLKTIGEYELINEQDVAEDKSNSDVAGLEDNQCNIGIVNLQIEKEPMVGKEKEKELNDYESLDFQMLQKDKQIFRRKRIKTKVVELFSTKKENKEVVKSKRKRPKASKEHLEMDDEIQPIQIAIATVKKGIGGTHLAIEIAHYYAYRNKKVAVVEMNESGTFQNMSDDKNASPFFIRNNIAFYPDYIYQTISLQSIIDNYDVVIFDLGRFIDMLSVSNKSESLYEFKNSDIKIMVASSNSYELKAIESVADILEAGGVEDVKYYFNFTSEKRFNELKKDVSKGIRIYRAEINENPFEIKDFHNIEKLIKN